MPPRARRMGPWAPLPNHMHRPDRFCALLVRAQYPARRRAARHPDPRNLEHSAEHGAAVGPNMHIYTRRLQYNSQRDAPELLLRDRDVLGSFLEHELAAHLVRAGGRNRGDCSVSAIVEARVQAIAIAQQAIVATKAVVFPEAVVFLEAVVAPEVDAAPELGEQFQRAAGAR